MGIGNLRTVIIPGSVTGRDEQHRRDDPAWLAGLLPRPPARILDTGCGEGALSRSRRGRRQADGQLRAVAPDCVTMCPICLINLRKAAGGTVRVRDIRP